MDSCFVRPLVSLVIPLSDPLIHIISGFKTFIPSLSLLSALMQSVFLPGKGALLFLNSSLTNPGKRASLSLVPCPSLDHGKALSRWLEPGMKRVGSPRLLPYSPLRLCAAGQGSEQLVSGRARDLGPQAVALHPTTIPGKGSYTLYPRIVLN